MRKFINKFTGTEMWVADNRVEEYKAAGHVLAAAPSPVKPAKAPVIEEKKIEEEPKEEPKVIPIKKGVAKRGKR